MLAELGSEASEFLSILKPVTCNVYSRGLTVFPQFYSRRVFKGFLGSCRTESAFAQVKGL